MKIKNCIYIILFLLVVENLTANIQKSFQPEIVVEVNNGHYYGVSCNKGFFISDDGGESWIPFNDGLPPRVVYPFENSGIKMLTAIAYDVKNPERIVVSTPRKVFLTEDRGVKWDEIKLKSPYKYSAYITSLALNPDNRDTIVVGTSFSGIYETADRGESWKRISDSIPGLYIGAGFFEEITAVAVSPYNQDSLFFLSGPTGEVYSSNGNRSIWVNCELPFDDEEALSMNFSEVDIYDSPGAPTYVLEIRTDKSIWVYNPVRNWWWQKDDKLKRVVPIEKSRQIRLDKASDKYGIYVSSWHASGERLDKHLQFVKDHNMNSVVVDMKDDDGFLTYDSSLSIPSEAGAIHKRINMETLLEKAHGKGIYVIARIPVFKDAILYKYRNNEYALKDNVSGGTWGKKFEIKDSETGDVTLEQREFWVDPFSEFVWEYNVSIAEELQNLGVDEIQFDYIRFPTDGNLSRINYTYKKPQMLRIEALESFLVMSRERIDIPISTDLYGFNSWYKMGNWNGQNIEMVSNYVDVISPMYYPSHFSKEFLNDLSYLDRAEEIYREGSRRSVRIVGNRSIIRPYIQAFLIGNELRMDDEEYAMYLNLQVKGTLESESSGFSLWNASNRYYMVTDTFKDYFIPES